MGNQSWIFGVGIGPSADLDGPKLYRQAAGRKRPARRGINITCGRKHPEKPEIFAALRLPGCLRCPGQPRTQRPKGGRLAAHLEMDATVTAQAAHLEMDATVTG